MWAFGKERIKKESLLDNVEFYQKIVQIVLIRKQTTS